MLNQHIRRLHKIVRIATDTVKDVFTSGVTSTKKCPICKRSVRIFWPYGVMLRPGAVSALPRAGTAQNPLALL